MILHSPHLLMGVASSPADPSEAREHCTGPSASMCVLIVEIPAVTAKHTGGKGHRRFCFPSGSQGARFDF